MLVLMAIVTTPILHALRTEEEQQEDPAPPPLHKTAAQPNRCIFASI
jgi:hypothetical protein